MSGFQRKLPDRGMLFRFGKHVGSNKGYFFLKLFEYRTAIFRTRGLFSILVCSITITSFEWRFAELFCFFSNSCVCLIAKLELTWDFIGRKSFERIWIIVINRIRNFINESPLNCKKIFNSMKFKQKKKGKTDQKRTNKWKNLRRLLFIVRLHRTTKTRRNGHWVHNWASENIFHATVLSILFRVNSRAGKCMRSDRRLSETPVSRMETFRHQMWMRADSLVGYASSTFNVSTKRWPNTG